MAQFAYRALTGNGRKISGEIDAADRRTAIRHLQDQGLVPIDAEPVRAANRPVATKIVTNSGGAAVTYLTRELAMLLQAGETLERSLAMVGEDSDHPRLAEAVRRILAAVRGGQPLSDALAVEDRLFSPIYVGMVRAGEATGRLHQALAELATLREREEDVRRKLTSAMIYPAVLTLVALASIGLMLGVVVPQFVPLFEGNEGQIPGSTQFILKASAVMSDHGETIIFGFIIVLLVGVVIGRMPVTKMIVDRLALRLPLTGRIARERASAQLGRGLSTLLRGGLDLPIALAMLRDMVSNSAVAATLDEVVVAVRQGQRLADALEPHGILVPMALRLLRSGEESGKLRDLASYVADRFEERLTTRIARLVTLIEPVLVITLGLVVGGIVMSIFTAVLSVNDLSF